MDRYQGWADKATRYAHGSTKLHHPNIPSAYQSHGSLRATPRHEYPWDEYVRQQQDGQSPSSNSIDPVGECAVFVLAVRPLSLLETREQRYESNGDKVLA